MGINQPISDLGGVPAKFHRPIVGMQPSSNWWDPENEELCIWAAYQPKGAASLVASYTDLSGNGNDAAVGVAPTWDAVNGWIFNGTTQYLTTGFVPQNDQSQTMLVQMADTTDTGVWAGSFDGATQAFVLQWSVGVVGYNGGSVNVSPIPGLSGNVAVAGDVLYWGGASIGSGIPAWGGAATSDVWIGAANLGGGITLPITGNIQAVAIYDCTLTAPQVAAIAARMA